MDTIKLQCRCGHTLTLPDKLAGQKIRCKKCGKVMTVPSGRLPARGERQLASESDPSLMVVGTRPCPGCGKAYPPTVKVCVQCGVNVDSGAMLYASLEDSVAPPQPSEAPQPTAPRGFFARLLGMFGLG